LDECLTQIESLTDDSKVDALITKLKKVDRGESPAPVIILTDYRATLDISKRGVGHPVSLIFHQWIGWCSTISPVAKVRFAVYLIT
jgi:hypothetical protein